MSSISEAHTASVSLTVDPEALRRFTTLLQSGIYLRTGQGTEISALLTTLPGFSMDYINNRVETVFVNGLPADNMQQKLYGETAVLALSAAMPGLAGAIFRKGGVHASLRSGTATGLAAADQINTPIVVRLKLFNIIAVERGVQLLADGCTLAAAALVKFLNYRPPLTAAVTEFNIDGRSIDPEQFAAELPDSDMIHLSIRGSHGS